MSDYSKLTDKVNGRKIQVDSAVRDGQGNKIDTRYITSDGYYEQLGAGYADIADNLTPYSDDSGITKDECFTFQTSGGGSDIGSTSQLKELKGSTFAFNQLIYYRGPVGTYGNVVVSVDNETMGISLVGTCNSDPYEDITIATCQLGFKTIVGHKYLYRVIGTLPEGVSILNNLSDWGVSTDLNKIVTCSTASSSITFRLRVPKDTVMNNTYFIQLYDLTLMYGVGNEPSEAIDFIRQFPAYHHVYEHYLTSPKSNKVITIGYNAFDGNWTSSNNGATYTFTNFVRVVPGQTYTSKTEIAYEALYFDCYNIDQELVASNPNYIEVSSKERTIVVPDWCCYIKVRLYNSNGITEDSYVFHLTWDDRKNDYEDYVKHEYELPNVELRSAGSAYDSITPSGLHTTRIGIIDLGSLTWDYGSESGHEQFYSTTTLTLAKLVPNSQVANIKCAIYVADSSNNTYSHTTNKTIGLSDQGRLFVYDSDAGTDPTAFKNSLSGVYLTYELNEPTTEQVNAYTENIVIDDFGTQEFVGGDSVPQCSTWFYAVDYKAFIDSLGNRQDIYFDASEIVSHTELTTAISQIPQPDLTALESNVSPKTNNTYDLGSSSYKWKDLYLNGGVYFSTDNNIIPDGSTMNLKASYLVFEGSTIRPLYNNVTSLGLNNRKFTDLYLSGNLSDGTNSVSVANISNGIFNVINASDISSNTLTAEQYATIRNGKPTLIKGTFLSMLNPVILSSTYLETFGLIIGANASGNYTAIKYYEVYQSGANYIIQVYVNKRIEFNNLYSINGKEIPNYPSNTGTFVLKCVNGTLTWVEE